MGKHAKQYRVKSDHDLTVHTYERNDGWTTVAYANEYSEISDNLLHALFEPVPEPVPYPIGTTITYEDRQVDLSWTKVDEDKWLVVDYINRYVHPYIGRYADSDFAGDEYIKNIKE